LEAEAAIRDEYIRQNAPFYDQPLAIDITYTTQHTEITLTPIGDHSTKLTADVDNLIKTTLDGLQGAAFENDRLVMRVTAVKQ
jgi:Holliday junction resolvase RusA-like endonuclease